ESFDGTYSIEVTCHAPKLEDVYREIFRVLKPGSIANSWQWDLHSSGSGNTLHWPWELILPVGTFSWQWECLVHFIPNMALEAPYESFDGAYSIEVTCHAPKLEDVYCEIFRVLKHGSMYVSYEWVTTDLYRAQNPKHMDIIQGIERGNALPGLKSYTHIVKIAKKVRFEAVKEKDLICKTTHEPMMV
nr:24-methylenesterol C-methyltransferase 2 [Tanacetum cinerariifolium]